MQSNIEALFLAYANASLRGHPGQLQEILNLASLEHHTAAALSKIVNYVMAFSKEPDPEVPREILRNVGLKSERDVLALSSKDSRYKYRLMLIAYYSTFGFLQKRNCDDCYPTPGLDRRKTLEGSLDFKSVHPKCYECDHALFRLILSEIVRGNEYTSICGGAFANLMLNASSDLRWVRKVAPSKEGTPFKEHLIEEVWWVRYKYDQIEYRQDGGFGGTGFNHMILNIAGDSLGEFLLHNDRRRLKCCRMCGHFFISNDRRRTRCKAESCRRAYEREKKRAQRDTDPVKYV